MSNDKYEKPSPPPTEQEDEENPFKVPNRERKDAPKKSRRTRP